MSANAIVDDIVSLGHKGEFYNAGGYIKLYPEDFSKEPVHTISKLIV